MNKTNINIIADVNDYSYLQTLIGDDIILQPLETANTYTPYFEHQAQELSIVCPTLGTLNIDNMYHEYITTRKSTLNSELLLQSAKIKATDAVVTLLDMNGGLGKDSILFALAGVQVTIIENNPFLYVILCYMADKLSASFKHTPKIIFQDSLQYANKTNEQFDYIYLDPMFEDKKSAKSKKNIQLIDYLINYYALIQYRLDYNELFNACERICNNKIIVKRDNKQAGLFSKPATYQKKGKTVRFDVYQVSCK